MEKQKNKKNQELEWAEIIKSWILENAKTLTVNAFKDTGLKIKGRFQKTLQRMGKTILSSMIILAGLIFLMIGLVKIINEAMNFSDSLGYIVVGIMVVLVAIVINEGDLKKNKKK